MAKKRMYEFFATYKGKQKVISISGVGRIQPEIEFSVTEKIFNTLKQDPNYMTRRGFRYVDI